MLKSGSNTVWWRSKTWKIMHRLHDRPTEEFLGATYWTTLCGKRVRADRIEQDTVNSQPPRPGCPVCKAVA